MRTLSINLGYPLFYLYHENIVVNQNREWHFWDPINDRKVFSFPVRDNSEFDFLRDGTIVEINKKDNRIDIYRILKQS
jgi:hypothetical protein